MGRRQHDKTTAGPKKRRRSFKFRAVVLNVFENIDIKDGIELPSFEGLQDAADDFVIATSVVSLEIRC